MAWCAGRATSNKAALQLVAASMSDCVAPHSHAANKQTNMASQKVSAHGVASKKRAKPKQHAKTCRDIKNLFALLAFIQLTSRSRRECAGLKAKGGPWWQAEQPTANKEEELRR